MIIVLFANSLQNLVNSICRCGSSTIFAPLFILSQICRYLSSGIFEYCAYFGFIFIGSKPLQFDHWHFIVPFRSIYGSQLLYVPLINVQILQIKTQLDLHNPIRRWISSLPAMGLTYLDLDIFVSSVCTKHRSVCLIWK